tara:strand:- start:281 stop:571 length:291 start_codon:yes stop_codon:yes gene_type:complete
MQVKVSKTIKFEEVPDYVAELIAECKTSLITSSELLRLSVHDLEIFTNRARQVQSALSDIAENIEDCVNIANGWHEANTKQQAQETQMEEQVIEQD